MSEQNKAKQRLEIAHVLFIDIVGYSKLLTDEQSEALHELNQIVRNTEAARDALAANQLTILPTGDGMALVFTGSVEEPVECALEISNASRAQPSVPVRMGIHSGPVHQVKDASGRDNIAGIGINIAQRVMDCGDAGHILISKRVADDLAQQRRWQPYLHELGDVEVKHGTVVSLVNLYAETIGNAAPPKNGSAKRTPESLKAIAVLPFVNMSADKNDEYLSDGMTEELINALAKVPGLRVPGRTSSFAFKGKVEEDIFRKVGNQLHVNSVLEGSVRKAGEKLRVTAQLINVSDGYHLWSKAYDGDVKDIFTFQSNVAERVAEALQGKLGIETARALTKKPTNNPEAHRLYLLGRYEFGKYTEAGWASSIRYYEQALKLDPNYALAYCGLADTYAYMGGVVMPSKEAVAKEKEFAQKALELDPELAEAHLSLACALGGAFDWRNAQIEFDRAIKLNPNLAWAYEMNAWFLCGVGRLDEAIAKDKKAIELDPLNSFFQASLAYFLYHARRYDDAIVQIRKTLELDPTSTLARHLLGCCLLWKGDTAGAIAEFQRSKIVVTGAWYQGLLGYAYAVSGDRSKAEEILGELEELVKNRYVNPSAFAAIYLGFGEKEKALDWLDQCYQNQESVCWLLKVDPVYDSVRDEPRFQKLLTEIFGSSPRSHRKTVRSEKKKRCVDMEQ
jgi:TolB-like protein/Tfp pilus assembly protein PilF/class 3 adenylate cyclase